MDRIINDIRTNFVVHGHRTSYSRLGQMAKFLFPELRNRNNMHAAMAVINKLPLDVQSFCCPASGKYNRKAMRKKAWGVALGKGFKKQIRRLERLPVH